MATAGTDYLVDVTSVNSGLDESSGVINVKGMARHEDLSLDANEVAGTAAIVLGTSLLSNGGGSTGLDVMVFLNGILLDLSQYTTTVASSVITEVTLANAATTGAIVGDDIVIVGLEA